jgi:hypothetical protein
MIHKGEVSLLLGFVHRKSPSNSYTGMTWTAQIINTWLEHRLRHILNQGQLTVDNNALYHSMNAKVKQRLKKCYEGKLTWLHKCDVTYIEEMTKVQQYELIKLYKPQYKAHKIDVLLTCHGHTCSYTASLASHCKSCQESMGYSKEQNHCWKCNVQNRWYDAFKTTSQNSGLGEWGCSLQMCIKSRRINTTTKGCLDNIKESLIWTVKMTVQNPAATICYS